MKYDFSEVIDMILDKRLGQVHTAIPACLSSYDQGKNMAVVQPTIKMRTIHNEEIQYPTIADVPVMFPNSNSFSLEFPLQRGDCGLLLFSEVGIGKWLASQGGSIIGTDDMTRFSLADGIFIPGLYPEGKKKTGTAFIKIEEDGKILISNNGGGFYSVDGSGKLLIGNTTGELFAELIKQIDELISNFTKIGTTATTQAADWTSLASSLGIGASSATANTQLAADMTASVVKLNLIKTILEGLKQ